jgi:hypothetical protein
VGNNERKLLVECIETSAWIESRGGPESVEAKRINIALNQVLNSLSDPSRESSEEKRLDLQTIDERDRAQDAVAAAAAILGCEEEWSNVHDHHLCLLELATERMAELSLLRETEFVHDPDCPCYSEARSCNCNAVHLQSCPAHKPGKGEVEADIAADRAWCNGAKFGYGCGQMDDRKSLDESITARQRDIKEAKGEASSEAKKSIDSLIGPTYFEAKEPDCHCAVPIYRWDHELCSKCSGIIPPAVDAALE